jgi:hypothetical protein
MIPLPFNHICHFGDTICYQQSYDSPLILENHNNLPFKIKSEVDSCVFCAYSPQNQLAFI